MGADRVLVKQWGPVDLILLIETQELVFCFDMGDCFEFWESATIIENWRARMNLRYVRECKAASDATLAHADALEQWSSHTRVVAREMRAVYGDRLGELMLQMAAEVEGALSWAATRLDLTNKPRTPRARAELFVTIEQWAFDRIREILAGSQRRDLPGVDAARVALLRPAMEALESEGFVTIKQEALAQRVRRLKVLPGEEDNLMADVLFLSREGGGAPLAVHSK